MENIMQKHCRDRESIQNTIANWEDNYSEHPQINSIWKVIPGFTTWTIWKERNRRIFKNEQRNIEHAKITLIQNISQQILVKCCADPAIQTSVEHQRILNAFNLRNGQTPIPHAVKQTTTRTPQGWTRPPEGFLKLNFDGASRGNPGPAGIGGIIRNQKGETLHIYSSALGEGTNNEMEFAAMEKGLRILQRNYAGKASNVVIEGDSKIVIDAASKIYTGTPASRVTKHWRLAMVTENIGKMLGEMKGLIFNSIRRKANAVADHLANHAIDHPTAPLDSCWHEVNIPQLKEECLQLLRTDTLEAERAERT